MTDSVPAGDTGADDVEDEVRLLCNDAVELVTHYLDDELNTRDLAAFEAHLDDCEGCTVFVDQIKMTITLTNATGRRHVKLMPTNFGALVADLNRRVGN